MHIIPSGIFHEHIINIVGNGVVIDPIVFRQEILALEKLGVNCIKNLFISKRAHLILPTHRLLDAASESAKGKEKIGSTLRGIGPAYMDKTGRNGLRIGDIFADDFKNKYDFLVEKHKQLLTLYDFQSPIQTDLMRLEYEWFEGIETIKKFRIIDSELFINNALANKKKVLAEGAQGSLLDIDFGSYPFVTSSNTICAGACTGLGIPPTKIGEVIGVFKAYCTRVGSGPFPTELCDETGERIRKAGNEFGATTQRPRRCGWLDIPALKYAVMLNGVSQLIMMKADVLSGMDTVKVCTHYKEAPPRPSPRRIRPLANSPLWREKNPITSIPMREKKNTSPHLWEGLRWNFEDLGGAFLPYDISSSSLTPVFKNFSGWKIDKEKISSGNIPVALQHYIRFIEQEVKVPISMISYGPDREEILVRSGVEISS
jgi:adenylosuccinate synthase